MFSNKTTTKDRKRKDDGQQSRYPVDFKPINDKDSPIPVKKTKKTKELKLSMATMLGENISEVASIQFDKQLFDNLGKNDRASLYDKNF